MWRSRVAPAIKKITQQKNDDDDDDKLWWLQRYANVAEKMKVRGLARKYSINLHNLNMSEEGVCCGCELNFHLRKSRAVGGKIVFKKCQAIDFDVVAAS